MEGVVGVRRFVPRDGFVVQAYRFALDPTDQQDAALRSHCGAARAAYNWAVNWVRASWSQRQAESTYGIPEEELTPWRDWNAYALKREFNRIKHNDPRFATWWRQNSKEAYSTGITNASAAFENYARSKRGARKGARVGLPRLRSRRTDRLACRFTTDPIRVEPDRRHVTLPVLGQIRVHENTRKLERRISAGTARILNATVAFMRGRWFVMFQVEVRRAIGSPSRPDTAVGVDLGIKHLAVLADTQGKTTLVPNPRHLERELAGLRFHSRRVSRRQGPDKRTGQRASKRWLKANAERNRIHHRVANVREDALHKFTTQLAKEYGHVVVEDLNVAALLKSRRRYAGRISDAAFGTIRRQLAYKTQWYGGQLVVADRWFPSSKTCSGCGAVKAKLPLHARVYDCETCGLVLDRDVNAARNLAAIAAETMSETGSAVGADPGARVPKPRRADHETRATGRANGPSGRAGGATPPHRGKETGDRHKDTFAPAGR